MARLRMLLLDPSALYREGIRNCLEQGGYETSSEAQNVEEAFQQLAVQTVDFILIGATCGEVEGLAAARSICTVFPNLYVILITEHSADPLFQIDAAALGVDALLRRRIERAEFWAVIERVMAGQLMVSRETLAAASESLQLSTREREVLNLWAEAKTDQEIAKELVMSRNTARTHARNILRKLQVHNRQMAVRRAQRRGLI